MQISPNGKIIVEIWSDGNNITEINPIMNILIIKGNDFD